MNNPNSTSNPISKILMAAIATIVATPVVVMITNSMTQTHSVEPIVIRDTIVHTNTIVKEVLTDMDARESNLIIDENRSKTNSYGNNNATAKTSAIEDKANTSSSPDEQLDAKPVINSVVKFSLKPENNPQDASNVKNEIGQLVDPRKTKFDPNINEPTTSVKEDSKSASNTVRGATEPFVDPRIPVKKNEAQTLLSFWTDDNASWNIYVDGRFVGQTKVFYKSTPSTNSNGLITVKVNPGNHSYRAERTICNPNGKSLVYCKGNVIAEGKTALIKL